MTLIIADIINSVFQAMVFVIVPNSCVENNHKNNSYIIYEMQGALYKKELAKGKEETLELVEFQKWLSEHGYIEDEHACKEARENLNKQAN